MAYAFATPTRLAVEIRRVAAERLDSALAELGDGLSADPAVAVHSARKDLKKTRSLLRLVKESLGPSLFEAENARLRDAAHLLAEAREADARNEALEGLVGRYESSMSPGTLLAAQGWLTRMSGGGRTADVELAASQAALLIARARDDAQLWALGHDGFGLIAPGLRRAYRQGRSGLAVAIRDPSDEAVHEWRKRVKDMWYSLRLLNDAWEPVLRPLADQAHDLSELLGDHHDLGEVRAALESGEAGVAPGPGAELAGLARTRQAEYHRAAVSLGRRLYSEGPRRYVERLGALWSAWEADTERHASQGGLPSS